MKLCLHFQKHFILTGKNREIFVYILFTLFQFLAKKIILTIFSPKNLKIFIYILTLFVLPSFLAKKFFWHFFNIFQFFFRTLLQFAKKKRKRSDSGSDVDMEDSATFAPKVDDSERRRSGRQTQRKKYVDDVDLNLSEDENLLMDNLPPDVQAAAKAADKNEDGNGKSEPASKEASKPNSGTTTPKEPPTPASTDGKADDNDVSQSGIHFWSFLVIFGPNW